MLKQVYKIHLAIMQQNFFNILSSLGIYSFILNIREEKWWDCSSALWKKNTHVEKNQSALKLEPSHCTLKIK